MIRSVAGQQEAYDNFIEWLLESEAQKAYEEYVGRKQREYGVLAEKKKAKERLLERRRLTPQEREWIEKLKKAKRTDPLPCVPLRKRKAGESYEGDFLTEVAGMNYLKAHRFTRCMLYNTTAIIDDLLFAHLRTKSLDDNQERLEEAKFVINTLRYPEEIWFQPINERLNFIKQFSTIRKGNQIILPLVVVVLPTGQVLTYYDCIENPAEINEKRWGKLLYKSS